MCSDSEPAGTNLQVLGVKTNGRCVVASPAEPVGGMMLAVEHDQRPDREGYQEFKLAIENGDKGLHETGGYSYFARAAPYHAPEPLGRGDCSFLAASWSCEGIPDHVVDQTV